MEQTKECYLGWKNSDGNSQGRCCCNCQHQVQLVKHPWNKEPWAKGSVTEQIGWVCVCPEMLPKVTYFSNEHSACECHEWKINETDKRARMFECEMIPKKQEQFLSPEQILKTILQGISDKEILEILSVNSKEDMIKYHHTAGQWIRNEFKLWDNDNPYIEYKHPDQLSFEIMQDLWTAIHLREKIGL